MGIGNMTIAIFKGCYPYFSLFAVCVIIWRIRTGLWNRRETIVLGCFAAHLLLEVLQIIIGDGKWEMPRRYLLPAAPLLFCWTAYGLRELYRKYRARIPAWGIWCSVFAAITLLLYDGMAPTLKDYYSKRKKGVTKVIAVAAPWIQREYSGKKQDAPPRHRPVYRSPYRPVVKSDFPALGFLAGGRSEPSPFNDAPDFWVLSKTTLSPADGVFCCEFTADDFAYVIYRRSKP